MPTQNTFYANILYLKNFDMLEIHEDLDRDNVLTKDKEVNLFSMVRILYI